MLFGAIPAGTKIYLEDRTLINIEDISIGDKLLSLKIEDDSINNSFDFYKKYVSDKSIKIPKNKLSFSSATVYQINLLKEIPSSQYYKTMYYNNPIFVDFLDNDIAISEIKDSLYEEDKPEDIKIKKENFRNFENFITFSRNSFKEDYLDEIFNKDSFQMQSSNAVDFGISPYYSLSLLDNYFYFSENFCFVGLVKKIKGAEAMHFVFDTFKL